MRKQTVIFSLILLWSAPVLCGSIFSKSVGKLKSDTAGVSLNLEGPWWSKASIGPESQATELKAGVYKPKRLSRFLVRKTAGTEAGTQVSETWSIQSNGPWGKLSKIKVEKGKTNVLKFGGPLLIKTDVKKMPVRDKTQRQVVSIGMKLFGEYGEVYSVRVRKGRQYAEAGNFKILTEDGKELATGKFKYG
jgi:hypothetical protein